MFYENKTVAGIALNDSSFYLFTPRAKQGVKIPRREAIEVYERLCDSEEKGILEEEDYDILGCLNVLIRAHANDCSKMEVLTDVYQHSTFFDCKSLHIIYSLRFGFYCAPSNSESHVDLHRAMELQHRLNNAFHK